MEYLLHYVWQHFSNRGQSFQTDKKEVVEVIDPGIHNILHSGPDFFNAKLKIDGLLWAGNVEIHEHSSDWYRHHHEQDDSYNNVVLHVVSEIDCEVFTHDKKCIPQLVMKVPSSLLENYRELLAEEVYPPCYRIIPHLNKLVIHSWLSRLTVERLEEKMDRISNYLQRTNNDWERTFFVTLARNFGFGTNAQVFEQWAFSFLPKIVDRHRDNIFQVEAFFMGQAGLLSEEMVSQEYRDEYYNRLCNEYEFLRKKYNLQPIDMHLWKFGRLRPQNFPYVRLSQFTHIYCEGNINFSHLLECKDVKSLIPLFHAAVTPYWRTHYTFGEEGRESSKILQRDSINLLIINTVVPLLFVYGKKIKDQDFVERSLSFLEQLPVERNYIIRCWERAKLPIHHAADSQALIQLRQHYCERKDCLRCRFGTEYLRSKEMHTV